MLQSCNKQEVAFGNCDSGHIFTSTGTDTLGYVGTPKRLGAPVFPRLAGPAGASSRFRRTMPNAVASNRFSITPAVTFIPAS
jgi:hypothetical protein